MGTTTTKYVVVNFEEEYLTPRRSTGEMYKNRVSWSPHLSDAKVFSTKGAATNSGKQSGVGSWYVLEALLNVEH